MYKTIPLVHHDVEKYIQKSATDLVNNLVTANTIHEVDDLLADTFECIAMHCQEMLSLTGQFVDPKEYQENIKCILADIPLEYRPNT